jgi:cysteine desulfurase
MAAIYLDCAATTPLDPRVRVEVSRWLGDDFGNAGSRTHARGLRAREAVERARDRVAAVVGASRGDVVFTSGATESNNLAILGLVAHGEATGRRHVVSTAIEHHAVLEPLAQLERRGFTVERLAPDAGGVVDADAVARALRPDTLLVSVMHVNNETGVVLPIEAIAERLAGTGVFLHVDAAQGFGKVLEPLRHARIDLMSVSGHKIHAPQGIGGLIARRRDGARPPLVPLMHGGGQERGLRPGTLPVHLIAGLGLAAELAAAEADERERRCRAFRTRLLDGLAPLEAVINGDPARSVPHADRGENVGPEVAELLHARRALAAAPPAVADPVLVADPGLVGKPQLDPLVGMARRDGGYLFGKPPFLKAACASGSFFGWKGRAFWRENPSRRSTRVMLDGW